MFEHLLRRLLSPAPETLPDPDARLALAALLVRLARTDGHYTAAEVSRIDQVLSARFGLGPFEVARLRGDAEVLETEAPDTVRFTRAIKEHVPYEERLGVIEALWEVALADGRRAEDEDALMRLVAPMLGVEDADSGLARQRVDARLR
ncbi:TerB family tellurite resistance protein [Rubellimicrobium rubrum]|uniref:TerB family tellurite resistance protein n=1 Tax=Rubellimicrobium rubrum TaxID=2585369 RepID=A0A5C4N1K4_9RHOB|nr:TerB family tellurite resistance protein [Rubellimicrobium rubrum]TNC50184.1 TerB family tellurite resistance protein [Rubellimicrobium rubrum]